MKIMLLLGILVNYSISKFCLKNQWMNRMLIMQMLLL